LKASIKFRNNKGLHQEIAEEGSNLSVGERQLICITRVILRKSKIIIMDEATDSIDYKTEEIIQRAITELLNGSTLITIAHRIKTIINYDKIIILDNRQIVDFILQKTYLILKIVYSINYILNLLFKNYFQVKKVIIIYRTK